MPKQAYTEEELAEKRRRRRRTSFLLDTIKGMTYGGALGGAIGAGAGGVYGGLVNVPMGQKYMEGRGIEYTPEMARDFFAAGAKAFAKPFGARGAIVGSTVGGGLGILRNVRNRREIEKDEDRKLGLRPRTGISSRLLNAITDAGLASAGSGAAGALAGGLAGAYDGLKAYHNAKAPGTRDISEAIEVIKRFAKPSAMMYGKKGLLLGVVPGAFHGLSGH